jgi:serine/threonine protein kinase/Tfp pilus assembly protein PilF
MAKSVGTLRRAIHHDHAEHVTSAGTAGTAADVAAPTCRSDSLRYNPAFRQPHRRTSAPPSTPDGEGTVGRWNRRIDEGDSVTDRERKELAETQITAPEAAGDEVSERIGEADDMSGRRRTGGDVSAHISDTDEVSERIGPYRIIREIGRGGMGVVYEAEQEVPVRRMVALKLIKLGMDTREVIARFESERQALALMNHPHIARVFDAGATPDGRPYFAMEFVQGVPITQYCDTHKLTIRERLLLFIDVCRGVQHAHQKGIIHRDIKPSNVLVANLDDVRVPKIIDFGIAKATSQRLSEHSVFTEVGQLVGTPEYMSPEQAEMTDVDVDTRSDIYSLGALLYELLAGQQVFDPKDLRRAGLAEIQRKLREEDPPKPSSRISRIGPASNVPATNRSVDVRVLERTLEGDLDWITMKALDKDRTRRYETANGLAMDVQRYLDDEPVLATPPSALYRARKLYRRHRIPVLAAAAVALALVAGIVGTTWASVRAARAERVAAAEAVEARRQTAIATAVNAFLTDDLLASAAPSTAAGRGKDVTMRAVLDAAAGRIEEASKPGGRFANEPLVEAAIRITLGNTYGELGEYAAAEPHLRRALALRQGVFGEAKGSSVEVMNMLGLLAWRQGRYDEAEPLLRRALAAAASGGQDDPLSLAIEMNLANVLRSDGRFADAEPLYLRNLDAKRRTLGPDHADTVSVMGNLANYYQETGNYAKAEALHRQALEIRRRLHGESEPATVLEINNLANDLALMGRVEEADPLMRRALELKTVLYGAAHPSTLNSVNNVAELALIMGRSAEAEALHRQALEGRRRALGPTHPRTLSSQERLAATLASLGQFADAERLAAETAAASAASRGADDVVTIDANDTRAVALLGLQRPKDAAALLRRQIAIVEERRAGGEDAGETDVTLTDLRVHLGMALADLGQRAEAEALLLGAVPALSPWEADTARAYRFVARFYDAWNRAEPDPARSARAVEWQQRFEASPRRASVE